MSQGVKPRNMYYILSNHDVVPIGSAQLWGQWFEQADRIVAQDKVGDCTVSTVFIGIDYAMAGEPKVFETLVTHPEGEEETWRYATWEQAEIGHQQAVESLG